MAAQFGADAEIQGLLDELRGRGAATGQRFTYSPDARERLRDEQFDLAALRTRGYGYERLDQLTMELLMGVR